MPKNYFTSILFSVLFLLSSCASYKAQYQEEKSKNVTIPNKEVLKTIYLIGDAGYSPTNDYSLGLTAFKNHIKNKKTEGDLLLFLGDNIYPVGLPKKDSKKRKAAENNLNAQLNVAKDFNGETIFIPGNHDWYNNGLKGLKREEKYVEDALGKNTFLPENGCPLESVDIDENIQLIIIDTQWYLENWNNHPTINDDCEIKTRERFFEEVEGELKKAQNKTIVFALHHPMYTNGTHGGFYGASKHLYPMQNNIPMPGLASLIVQIRSQGGVSIQDRYNERYNELMNRLEALCIGVENLVLVSGHEHSLQYIENEGIKQIVSGSGSKKSAAALNNNGLFSYGEQGFAKLIIYKDGSSWVEFYSHKNTSPLFTKEVHPPYKHYDVSHLPNTFPSTIKASVYSKEETNVSDFFKTFWGEHYRDIYSKKIEAKVATLDTLYGGLEIVRKGGGHQTKSLRLKTKDGKELNMRALRKSANQYLQTVLFKDKNIQDNYEKTAVERLILDFYTAAHPYAFMVVPELSNAIGVLHTNPEIFYIPKQKYLGEYNKDFGDELYLIEERPEENYSEERTFGYADDIESSHDIIEKIRKDEKYKIDEEAYIKARLFDMLLGDWDRHQDQWRWAQFDQTNGDKLYRPIPRDRDQVFANFDGGVLDFMRFISSSSKQLQVYDDDIEDVEWINNAGIKLDRTLVQNSDEQTWVKMAKFIEENITDEVIEKAFLQVPEEVRDTTLEEIKQNLKGRRGNLVDIAKRYADFLNTLVILTGTDKDDFIDIIREEKNKTHIIISRNKKGKRGEIVVDRTLERKQTKEIWVYGLDDDDQFFVSGNPQNPIKIRLIGGLGHDKYTIKNGRKIKVYDHKSKANTIEKNKGADINFTDVYDYNLFDYKKYITKSGMFAPLVGYNPDDGFSTGITISKTKSGFERNPFTYKHQVAIGYYFATNGFDIRYKGEYSLNGQWNLHLNGVYTTNSFTNNFFGYGNETENFDDDLGWDYNRVKTSIYSLKLGLLKKAPFGSDYGVQTTLEGIKVNPTEGRYITDLYLDENNEFYERHYFGGIEALYTYKSFDDKMNPTKGMNFNLEIGAKTQFEDTDYTFGYINSGIGFYNSLSKNRKLVLKTDVNTQLRFGDDIFFYHAANLGGRNGLRAYRNERFTGKHSLVGSADIRYSFNRFKTRLIPIQIGVFGGADTGRVWAENETSTQWHASYGGGFWVTAADSVSGTFNFFTGKEGLRFSFGFGFNF
ncbi:metallophosphoesterase [Tenacibaculum sp. IB213877]|uniref:metallophosphoesterase n=1 Tax=Tenacibaculum sp. IB213877 TaxID=3097351 RepID=UPI002A59B6D1|nr:metallophosphoesterase [Tenacibaculum sp. IB213877]MDY0779337.1 metallophosphoesterase [Tenacibaculum sp. IB213877]